MKKLLALVMALVMIMVISVPAFAALDQSTQAGDVVVKTNIAGAGDGTYTVEIPATMVIDWDAASTAFSYKVTSQLVVGKVVNVTISDKDGDGSVMKATGGEELPYTLTGTISGTTTAPVVTDAKFDFAVEIAPDVWDAAALAEYSDTVTFTSSIVNA